jgi:hypothetical protein
MFKKSGVTYEFHHLGIPTTEEKPGEYYSSRFDLWSADVENSSINAQFHRFGPNTSLHPLMAKYPHVGFKVNDIEKAVEGEEVIMEIYEPIPGYKAAMINDAGIPVEFVQTDLTDEELYARAKSGQSVVRDIEKS